jgi:hypothetical protein
MLKKLKIFVKKVSAKVCLKFTRKKPRKLKRIVLLITLLVTPKISPAYAKDIPVPGELNRLLTENLIVTGNLKRGAAEGFQPQLPRKNNPY